MATRLTKTALAVMLVATGPACSRSHSSSEGLSPKESRALLLDPDAPFWKQPAPPRYSVGIETARGRFVIEVERALAPRGADRFYRLVAAGYFDDSRFSRVVP